MLLPNVFQWRRLGYSLTVLFIAASAAARGGDGFNPGAPEVPRLTTVVLPGEVVGNQQVMRQVLRFGTNEFGFVIPDGLGTRLSAEGAIVLGPADQTYLLTIRRVESPSSASGLKEALEQRLADEYPGAERAGEFAMTVAGREGTGIDLQKEMPKVGRRFVRTLWVPFKAGCLEITLNSGVRHTTDALGAFDAIVLTFRSNERGKLEFVRRLDRS